MKQLNFLGEENSGEKYSTKIEAPVYTPSGQQPLIEELAEFSKMKKLIESIENSTVTRKERDFLLFSAYRHIVFNYQKIADYYAHASKEMQELMEASGLVIVDFDKAVEHGYIKLCDAIRKQYLEEYHEE